MIGGLTSVTSASRSAKSHWSLEESFQGRSAQFVAAELGLKFGDIPTSPMAPSYSFGSGNREGRAKLFHGQDELSTSTTDSPGPNTAKSNMPYAVVSQVHDLIRCLEQTWNEIRFIPKRSTSVSKTGSLSCVGRIQYINLRHQVLVQYTRADPKIIYGPGFGST